MPDAAWIEVNCYESIDRITKSVSVDSMKQRFNTADGAPDGAPETSKEPKIGTPGIIRKGINLKF